MRKNNNNYFHKMPRKIDKNNLKFNLLLSFFLIISFILVIWIKNLYQTNYYLSQENFAVELDLAKKDKEIKKLLNRKPQIKYVYKTPIKTVIRKPNLYIDSIKIKKDTL